MSGYSGTEFAVPSFTLHSFLQDSCGQRPWRALRAHKQGSSGQLVLSQSCGVVTSWAGTVLLADTYKAGEITLTEECF